MKAQELIDRLQYAVDNWGNVDVIIVDKYCEWPYRSLQIEEIDLPWECTDKATDTSYIDIIVI